MQPSNLDAIGAGALARGHMPDGVELEHPVPLPTGTALGQHLRIERLVRVVEDRQLYLANNVDPLWAHKKCWHCGNRYNPNRAQACSYCGTPLQEQRFMASVRHDRNSAAGWEAWLRLRVDHPAISKPVAGFYRDGKPVTVFAYYGESLLADQPSPVPAASLVPIAHRLGVALGAVHAAGVLLAPFTSCNVIIMPDGTARFIDLHARAVLGTKDLAHHSERPILADVRRLCAMLLRLADPDDTAFTAFLRSGVDGHHGPPRRFCAAIEQFHPKLVPQAFEPVHAGFSDIGLVRRRNEDHWGWRHLDADATLYVVADGMGGHEKGEVASRLAVETVLDKVEAGLRTGTTNEGFLRQLLIDAVQAANAAICEAAGDRLRGMGSTLVALLLLPGGVAFVAHAGDSRAYLRRGPTLRQVTLDHSLVQAMVERGTITTGQARTHPKANVVLNFLGHEPQVDVDVEQVRTLKGDRWLLCSDGVWGQLADQEIRFSLDNWPEPRRVVRQIAREVLALGAKDNLTLIVVDVTG